MVSTGLIFTCNGQMSNALLVEMAKSRKNGFFLELEAQFVFYVIKRVWVHD